MTILKTAYEVCKYIKSLAMRQEIKELIYKMHTARSSHGDLGYIAKHKYIQFLGYLIVSQQKKEIESGPLPIRINTLSQNELAILEQAHRFILQINKNCCEHLKPVLPNAVYSIDPYVQYNYKFQNSNNKTIDSNVDSIRNLYATFTNHPSFKIIQKYVPQIKNIKHVPKEYFLTIVLRIVEDIISSGPFTTPSELRNLEFTLKKNSQEYYISTIIKALIALRSSLSLLDQLLYQAFQFDKLSLLDQNNIFTIEKRSGNLLGESMSILIQPIGRELFSNPNDTILVKLKSDNHNIDCLFRVEGINLTFNRDFGTTQKFGLRKVDDNLNPYPRLTREK